MAGECTADEAAAVVEDGDEVVVDTARPNRLLEAIAARSDLADVSVYAYGYPYADSDALASLARTPGVSLSVSMIPPTLRDLVVDETVSYLPRTLYAVARNPFPRSDPGRRIALLGASADEAGDLRPSCLSTFAPQLVEEADVTAAERNAQVPPAGTESIPASRVDRVVESSSPPPVLRQSSFGETERAVARNVASLFPEYPTLQLGIGSIANALGEHLDDGPFDVWSGLIGEPTRTLAEAGAVRSMHGCVAAGEDESFYDWTDRQTALQLASPLHVHAQSTLASLPRFVAVNSALQVDLSGQVNAETVDGRPLGGIGGQVAFMRGASLAPDGLAIIALRSRTPGGTPKVVPSFGAGDPTTTPRYAVDAVVTEYGVANVGNRSTEDRATELISIAHPDDRPELRDAVG